MVCIGDRVALKNDGNINNDYTVIAKQLLINKPSLIKLSRFDGYSGWFTEDKVVVLCPAERYDLDELLNHDIIVGRVNHV